MALTTTDATDHHHSSIYPTPSLLDDDDDDDDIEEEWKEAAEVEKAEKIVQEKRLLDCNNNQEELERQQQQQKQETTAQLRQRYEELRQARMQCARQRHQCQSLTSQMETQTLILQQQQESNLLLDYLSFRTERNIIESIIQQTQQWNVMSSDAFYITCGTGSGGSTTVVAATINGLRLGAIDTVVPQQQQSRLTAPPTTSTTTTTRSSNSSSVEGHVAVGPVHPPSPSASPSTKTTTVPPTEPPPSHMPLAQRLFSSLGGGGGNGTVVSTSSSSSTPISASLHSAPGTAPAATITNVPWREINAALGQVALLLSVLEQNLTIATTTSSSTVAPSGESLPTTTPATTTAIATSSLLMFRRYDIQCRGSTSRIGLRKTPPSSISYYNLYYSEDSTFAMFFGQRHFNTALTMLLDCMSCMATYITQLDRTVQIPYAMHVRNGTIGGLRIIRFVPTPPPPPGPTSSNNNVGPATSISHQQLEAENWTRAMKYLLTNLKHMMAFRGIGLWTTTDDGVSSQ